MREPRIAVITTGGQCIRELVTMKVRTGRNANSFYDPHHLCAADCAHSVFDRMNGRAIVPYDAQTCLPFARAVIGIHPQIPDGDESISRVDER